MSTRLCLVLVRHGETTANRDNILQGTCDYPLTDKGKAEAAAVGNCLRDVAWKRVLTSDLPRARNTCNIMLETRRDEGFGDLLDSITPLELIREISFGIREERPRSVSLAEARKIVAAEKGIAEKDVIDNAETSAQIKERQINFLRFIRGESAASSEDRVPKVLAVSHGGFIRRFLANHCDRNIEKIRNCSVTIINVRWPAAGDDEVLCECREDEVDVWDHLFADVGEQQPQDVYSFPSLRL